MIIKLTNHTLFKIAGEKSGIGRTGKPWRLVTALFAPQGSYSNEKIPVEFFNEAADELEKFEQGSRVDVEAQLHSYEFSPDRFHLSLKGLRTAAAAQPAPLTAQPAPQPAQPAPASSQPTPSPVKGDLTPQQGDFDELPF